MITLPKLTDKDLEIFKGKKVVVYSTRLMPFELDAIFKKYNINVIGYYVKNIDIKRQLKFKLKGMKVLSLKQLQKLSNNKDILIQSYGFDYDDLQFINSHALSLNLSHTNFSSGQLLYSFGYLTMIENIKESFFEFEVKLLINNFIKFTNIISNIRNISYDDKKHSIIICSPPKTADFSIMNTFDKSNKKNDIEIKCINFWHTPKRFLRIKDFENKKIRVIVGLREPISQNLSIFFHKISSTILGRNWILDDLRNCDKMKAEDIISYYKNLFLENNDIQKWYSIYIQKAVYSDKYKKIISTNRESIQRFILDFNTDLIDILEYPFNKEKGYTIIKEGNIEVFVYQLEKLNNLVPELSEWVGIPFTELVRGNDASDKWIADSYKQAQKEIGITQEYFDRCYNEPYVQHCYSQADIEKFKERWRPHIK